MTQPDDKLNLLNAAIYHLNVARNSSGERVIASEISTAIQYLDELGQIIGNQ
jgi:hypothetical protein